MHSAIGFVFTAGNIYRKCIKHMHTIGALIRKSTKKEKGSDWVVFTEEVVFYDICQIDWTDKQGLFYSQNRRLKLATYCNIQFKN